MVKANRQTNLGITYMNKNIIKAGKSRKICFARELNVDYLWNRSNYGAED